MRYLLLIALAIFLAMPAQARDKGGDDARGGFNGPVVGKDKRALAAKCTVKEAMEKADDSIVELTGNIVGRVGDSKDKYIFKDATGEMIVEIGRKRFRGLDVTPETPVRIFGEVDKDWGKDPKIEVKILEKAN